MSKPFPFTVCKECASGSGGGVDGLSAYEIAVKNGFVGSEEEWLESLKAEITDEDIAEIIKEIDETHAHYCKPAEGVLLPDKAIGVLIPTTAWVIIDEDGDIAKYGVETGDMIMEDPGITTYKYFRVSWGGKIYDVPNTSQQDNDVYLCFTDAETNLDVIVTISNYYTGPYDCAVNVMLTNATYRPNDITLEITAATGSLEEEVRQLDVKYIPDYVSKTEVEETVGNIESALDGIIAMQNELIGGDTV